MPAPLTFAQVKPFITADLKRGKTPALLGEPGIGKSSLIQDLAREFKTQVFTLPVNQLADRADLTGVRMTQDKDGNWQQEAFPHSTIMQAIQYALNYPKERPILFLDEFNRATSDITSSILSFTTERCIGTVQFPDNLRIIVAGNDNGNVTAVDKASISRFALYKVRPDLETFMSIQTLNPYINAVLTKHPEDLTAVGYESGVKMDTQNDDEENENAMDLTSFDFMSEGSFEQITCPRTITNTSEWLNELGLDKSGNDAERQFLGTMFQSMTEDQDQNILLAAIEGHVGRTTFSLHLFEEIQQHFNAMISQTHVSNQPALAAFRPKQSWINELHRSANVQEVEKIAMTMSDKERLDTIVWLTEAASVLEVNNNSAVTAYMTNAPQQISAITPEALQSIMTVLPDASRVSKPAVEALLASTAPALAPYLPVFRTFIEQD